MRRGLICKFDNLVGLDCTLAGCYQTRNSTSLAPCIPAVQLYSTSHALGDVTQAESVSALQRPGNSANSNVASRGGRSVIVYRGPHQRPVIPMSHSGQMSQCSNDMAVFDICLRFRLLVRGSAIMLICTLGSLTRIKPPAPA